MKCDEKTAKEEKRFENHERSVITNELNSN